MPSNARRQMRTNAPGLGDSTGAYFAGPLSTREIGEDGCSPLPASSIVNQPSFSGRALLPVPGARVGAEGPPGLSQVQGLTFQRAPKSITPLPFVSAHFGYLWQMITPLALQTAKNPRVLLT